MGPSAAMEDLFMQVFERKDWVQAQMRQQVDSYAQSLAYSLLAACRRPPKWLLPTGGGGVPLAVGPQELLFPGSQITTLAHCSTFFQPPTFPSTFFCNVGVPNENIHPETNGGTVDTSQQEDPHQQQALVNQELTETCAEVNMFSRIQRSRSRKRNKEDHLCEKDRAANSRSIEGMQNRRQRSTLATMRSNETTELPSSELCADGANNCQTTSSRPWQQDDFNANQAMSTESLKCSAYGGLGSQGAQINSFPSVVLENQNLSSENHVMISNNCSARNLQRKSHLDISKLKTADSVCHLLPESHLLVKPKKLKFDGVELGPMNLDSTSEPMDQYQKYASEITLPDLTVVHSLIEDPSSTNSLEGPCSMVSPLFQKDTLHIVEIKPPEGPFSMASPLLGNDMLNNAETKSLEGSYYIASPLLENDTSHNMEDIQRTSKSGNFSDQTINGSSKFIEQQNSESYARPPCNGSSPADAASGVPASLGMLLENVFETGVRERFLCAELDATTRCSQVGSAANPEQLLTQTVNDGGVCRHSIVSSRTQTNDRDSNGAAIADAFVSAENGSCQEQNLLARSSLEFDRNCASLDTSMGSPTRGTSNGKLKGKPVLNSIDCYSEQLGPLGENQVKDSALTGAYDVSVSNRKCEPAVLKLVSSISAESTKMLQSADRNGMASAHQSAGSLQQYGTEQKICGFENDVETNAYSCTTVNNKQAKPSQPSVRYFLRSSGSHEKIAALKSDRQAAASDWKRLIANEVQVNESSSIRRRKTCQSDIILSNSPTRSRSSLNCQVGIGGVMGAAANLSGKSQPSARHFLRSSGSHGLVSLKSGKTASNQKRSAASEVHANENSSSKRRNMDSVSDVILCNSSRMKALSLGHHGSCSSQSTIVTSVSRNSCSYSLQDNLDTVTTTTSLCSCSDVLSGCKEHCTKEGSLFLKDQGQPVTTLTVEYQDFALQIDDMTSGSEILSPEHYSSTNALTAVPSHSLDQKRQQASARNSSIHQKLSYSSRVELDEKGRNDDPKRHAVSDTAIPWQNSDGSANCNETMPEFESFSIPVPSNSPTIEERAFEAFCDSRKLVTLSSNLSMKYKINTLSDVYQSLATRFEKLMNRSSLNADDIKQLNASYNNNKLGISGACGLELDGSFFMPDVLTSGSSNARNGQESYNNNKLGISGACGLELDGSFFMPDVLTCGSSNARNGQESSQIPLTPSVEKYSLENLLERSGSSSKRIGSIPELACFRIDEDRSIVEENENQEVLPGSVDRNYSNQWPTGRKALQDVSGLHQNTGKSASISTRFTDSGRLDLTTMEVHSADLDHHSNLRNDHACNMPKENHAPSVKREGKVSASLRDRLSRTEMLGNKKGRHGSAANLEKGCKPSNIVANVASFIPLVKQKQQSTTACVKKDVRVKALEAAEAAKRLEEKRQYERELRKAASKLERERLKQEKELKRKQEEQKKKKDADIATRKRQREEEEKKGKERKKKCIEEARKQQKQPMERVHATNDEKDAHRKASDDKETRKNLVEGMKSQLKSDERKESVDGYKAIQNNTVMDVVADERSASFGLQVQKSVLNIVEKSYEMSPYKDSDEEDDNYVKHVEELRRKRKSIPSWAQKENLDKILLSNQTLDPREIFSRKCSFTLNDVLLPQIPQRRFN